MVFEMGRGYTEGPSAARDPLGYSPYSKNWGFTLEELGPFPYVSIGSLPQLLGKGKPPACGWGCVNLAHYARTR